MQREPRRPSMRFLVGLACLTLLLIVWAERSLLHTPAPRPAPIEEQAKLEPLASPTRPAEPTDVLVAPLQPVRPQAPSPQTPPWVQSRQGATLQPLSGLPSLPDEGLPEGSYLQVIGADGGRMLVRFGGDGHKLRPTMGWIDAAAVTPSPAPRWVITTSSDIRRTVSETEENLYRHQRSSVRGRPFHYRFYYGSGFYQARLRIELHFAELEKTAPRERIFDVLVDGQPLVSGLDLYAVAGAYSAYVVSREVTVTSRLDGDQALDIAFVPRVGEAAVAGISVAGAWVAGAVFSFLVSYWPARRSARLEPAVVLRG